MTMSEYVTRLLRRDLSRPTIEEWLAQHPAPTQRREIDVTATLDAVRVEYAPDEALTPSAQAR